MCWIIVSFAIDKDIKLKLEELATKGKEFVEKEKEMYTAMFNS
jgi:hypothetical protein